MLKKSTITQICSMALALVLSLGTPVSLAQDAKTKNKTKTPAPAKLTEQQKVVHVLERITFGPRPGDVERVQKLGWEKYLNEQLHPEKINDELAEQKLKSLESIHLSNSELAKNYPPPQVIRELLKERGIELPAFATNNPPTQAPAASTKKTDKREAKQGFKQLGKDAQKSDEMEAPTPNQDQASKDQASKNQAGNQPSNIGDLAKRREAYQALREMGFRPQQEIVQELQQAKILRAVYSEKQLQEVMTDFWFNHFNVFINKGADRVLTTSYERDAIRPHVFGKFEDLLKATAENPAMLFYLDNWMSASPNARRPNRQELRQFRQQQIPNGNRPVDRARLDQLLSLRNRLQNANRATTQTPQQQGQMPSQAARLPQRARGLNENYAREIMELHTLGVDGGYTQKDVQEVARCFTGWTLRQPRNGAEFVFNPFMHDDGEKTVLGKKIPAGGGVQDGYAVIHLLATHPSTAKFISTKLARKFVNDNPPASLVEKMAQTFQKSGGDLREVLHTMFTAPEFFAPENFRAKIKTPFEMTVSAVRALGAETNGGPQFHRWLAQMGEGLFLAQPPTGYPDTAEHWVNTGALLERMNFAVALASNRVAGTRVNLETLAAPGKPSSTSQAVDYYVKLFLHGNVSPQTRATIDQALNDQQLAMASAEKAGNKINSAKIIGLILGSPEFQRQ